MSLVPALTGTASALPLPNTAPTPAPAEMVRAEDVQEAVQALLNQDATLQAAFRPAIVDTWISVRAPVVNEVSKSSSSYNITVTPGDIGSQIVDFPNGVSIDGVRVYVDRTGGIEPGTRLSASVKRRNRSTNVESDVLAFTLDTAANIGDYNAYHAFEVLFADSALDNSTYLYYVRVDGEIAPDEQNFKWFGSSVRVSLGAASWV